MGRASGYISGWLLNRGAPPTRLASVLLLPPPSPPLTALKRRDMSTCPLWMSQWPRISARPRLSDGRRGRVIRRLFTPIRSKTTALPRCGRHHSAQQGRSSPARRGDESAGKGAIEIERSESGFYSRYFLIPKKVSDS